jgi:hypothetical protein
MPNMLNIQAFINNMREQAKSERAATQLTLGELINVLNNMPADTPVANLRKPGSYRGYYEDLYFERHEGTRPASELLADCKAIMGQMFTGYKGGEFMMGAVTPLWVASYGTTGQKLIAVYAGGELNTAEDTY